MEYIIGILTVLLVLSLLILIHYRSNQLKINQELILSKNNYSKLVSQKKSSEVRLGQISENLAPFLTNFKYDPKRHIL
jgi:predicted Holliday junction resolvase-like endonuclease